MKGAIIMLLLAGVVLAETTGIVATNERQAAPEVGDEVLVGFEHTASSLQAQDANIRSMSATNSTVTIEYEHPARLFGLFDVTYIATASADSSGRVKVRTPWWLFLAVHDAPTEADFAELQQMRVGETERQQRVMTTLSNVMKTKHDTAMNSIRNMKG